MLNVSSVQQFQGALERALFSTLTTLPCCVFLFINGTMLFTLRSKAVFCETSRYVLLFNLLLADTVQMFLSQLLYIMAAVRVTLTYPLCGALTSLANLTTVISPVTLVLMSLERYVAVCYPLRHAAIITMRNTTLAVVLAWAFSSLNTLIQVFLLLEFPFEDLPDLQMKNFCSVMAMLLGSASDQYDESFTCFLFVSSGLVVVSTYIGVIVAARAASTDKAAAHKARNTLLLHLFQLGLSLSSTIYNPLLIALSRVLTRIVLMRIQNVLYVCVFIFPRCLSSLIYGIRDRSIRPVLVHNLCCRLKLSVKPVSIAPTVG
ncbi:odorant receptor 131-2-like [Odontesthes bonariensis]|uniref:odorant receptor 131-2-like n=1 Tax=Odontesthes bonariensis TaxID=219752 RepID=UPI003F58E421